MEKVGRDLGPGSGNFLGLLRYLAHRKATLGTEGRRSPCRICCNFGTAVIYCIAFSGDDIRDMI